MLKYLALIGLVYAAPLTDPKPQVNIGMQNWLGGGGGWYGGGGGGWQGPWRGGCGGENGCQ
ncbi:hypothetical protein GGH94_000782 [Coemansia aciculifera]|uniref:Uncharacterized protein n=1 Tax=Coemansia aciculifera TaxID=417176 RepID=A0A9W8M7J6_9FUNG|nr:hypothetical protein GGH94_000782 [Coemansia aciculifera]KAJ2872338.1 hypothetical protein GGH93_004109 [Coemansia aciculifera]